MMIKDNYKEDESLVFLKMHHIMSDGLGIATYMSNLVDNFDQKLLPPMRNFKWYDKLMIYITIPYYFVRMTLTFLLYKPDRNPLQDGKLLSGTKKGSFTKHYSLAKLKEKTKTLNVTFNDLIQTAISITLKEYFKR